MSITDILESRNPLSENKNTNNSKNTSNALPTDKKNPSE